METLRRLFFSWDALEPFLGSLLKGFWLTVQLTFAGFFFAIIGGIVLAVMPRRQEPKQAKVKPPKPAKAPKGKPELTVVEGGA